MHFRWHRVNIGFVGKQLKTVRENRRDKQEWTIQRHQQQSKHETQEFLKESTTVVIKITPSVCAMFQHNYHSHADSVKMLDMQCVTKHILFWQIEFDHNIHPQFPGNKGQLSLFENVNGSSRDFRSQIEDDIFNCFKYSAILFFSSFFKIKIQINKFCW
jgi:hypothetical protein